MNFLNSAFLAGLAAAVVPLLIHLLNRRKVKTVEFSSVMFLRDLRKSRMRRLELRRWLLLAVRTLLITSAVLAFARPALQGNSFAGLGGRARTSAVIALDQSASMAMETPNGTAAERAQRRVREIGALFGEGDEVTGLLYSDDDSPQTDPPTAAVGPLIERLANSEVGFGATDATAALKAANTALAGASNLNREIFLISDRRREGFTRSPLDNADVTSDRATVYLIDVADDEESFDLGVTGVELANQLLEPHSPFTVTATVKNHTARPVDRLLASLFIDGRRIAQEEVSVAPEGTATVALSGSIGESGVHAGFIEISPDDNPRDNRRHFAVSIPDQIRVLLVSDYPMGRRVAALALAPQPGATARLIIDEIDSPELVRKNLFDYDAVLITDWRAPERLVCEQIQRFVRSGGGVFMAPAFDADTTAWNTLVASPHFRLRLGPLPNAPSNERFFIWDRIDWNHPIWSVYRDVPADRIPEIRWFSIFRTEGQSTAGAIVDFSGGRPALSEARIESGKWLVSWSPLNPPYTDLPLRSLFVPFMNRLVEYLAADLSERRGDFLVGEPVVREPSRAITANATLEISRPDGSLARPGLESVGTRTRITYDDADAPGVYTITANGKPIDAFSVNVDPKEMDAALIERDELARRWPGFNIIWVEPGQAIKEAVTQTRYGTELRPLFLWLAAAFFFLEMYLARTRKRDIAIDTSEATPLPESIPARG
jgi:hypothetical protein